MAWEFLRSGKSALTAQMVLQARLQSLHSLAGSLNSEPVLAATRYMTWTEETERNLRSLYSSPAVARSLHTDRYWQIRGITSDTKRPEPLIRGEIEDQEYALTILANQLERFQRLLNYTTDERFLVCDTNVLVHGKPFHELPWNDHFEEKRVCIVLPLIVIDELDALKDRGVRPAGGVLKDLDRLLPRLSALDRIEVRRNVSLQVVDEPPGHERLRSNDDEIVHQMTYFAALCDEKLTLVTRDRGMRVRAQAAGLDARYLPDGYERRKDDNE
ncbi:PIN domain-containing protein [Paenarthrobacter sp. NPDC091711]|uniref:PIN domain-containing protein n=1 Tax=Paenarthrobacter sp. NPDC091711 TaxID=3364385 RepID=UPI00382F97C4